MPRGIAVVSTCVVARVARSPNLTNVPSPFEIASPRTGRALLPVMLATAFAMTSCGRGATDSTPPLPLTAVARVDLQVAGDSLLLGDSVLVTARAVNRVGDVLPLASITWSSTDSGVGAVTDSGRLRARNVGTIRIDALVAGAVGTRTVRVVPRSVRVRLLAPDTVQLVDAIQLASEVETAAGVQLAAVAPRFASADTAIVRVQQTGIGVAIVRALLPGTTDLLAIIGRDTTRRRIVVRLTPLRSLQLAITQRVVSVGDSVPLLLAALDSLGRNVPTAGTVVGFEPEGSMLVRNGHLIALGIGRVVVSAVYGPLTVRDTLTAQGPSEFPLEIVDGDGQNPLPLRVRLSMERVAAKWRQVIRSAPPGDFVRLQVGDCRNAVPVSQFISGVRVLIKLDTLPARIVGQGGPCVLRSSGLPLLGTISLNIFTWSALSDRKLDDLIQHEVGHVLGIGTMWTRGSFSGLIVGDSSTSDPIFVGPNALGAFAKLGRSARFQGRVVPVEANLRGHWRGDAFHGEVMAPSLIPVSQPTSAVTVAALRDLGWNVELEAYEEFALPSDVLTGAVSPQIRGRATPLESDLLLPEIVIINGRRVRMNAPGGERYR